MDMKSLVLSFVLSWVPAWHPEGWNLETEEGRNERREMIVEVAEEVSYGGYTDFNPADNLALTLTLWKFESGNFEYHVHGKGESSPLGTQDAGNAVCLGQIHRIGTWWSEEEWRDLAGRSREATKRCAVATQRIFEYHARRCKIRHNIPKAQRWKTPLTKYEAWVLFTAYGTGFRCDMKRTKNMIDRMESYDRIRRKLPAHVVQKSDESEKHESQ